MAAPKVTDMVEINLRLPATLKAELVEQAGYQHRSLNSEILLRLHHSVKTTPKVQAFAAHAADMLADIADGQQLDPGQLRELAKTLRAE